MLLKNHFNPIQDGPFWGCSRIGGRAKKLLSLESVIHIMQGKLGTVIPFLKKIQNIYKSRDTPLEVC